MGTISFHLFFWLGLLCAGTGLYWRRKTRDLFCRNCGYDLSRNKRIKRCPGCKTVLSHFPTLRGQRQFYLGMVILGVEISLIVGTQIVPEVYPFYLLKRGVPMWLVGGVCVLTVGSILVWLGRRGRAVSQHPICRSCGFDLHGQQAHDPKWRSGSCSECGSNLFKLDAVIYGQRRRLILTLWLGRALWLLVITICGFYLTTQAKEIAWHEVKPNWWLLKDLKASDAYDLTAFDELAVRQEEGQLSKAIRGRIVTILLDHQVNQKMWHRSWGQFIVNNRTDGELSDERWKQYLTQGIIFRSRLRNKAALDGTLVVADLHVGFKLHGANYSLRCNLLQIRIGESAMVLGNRWEPKHYTMMTRLHRETHQHQVSSFNPPLKPGRYPVEMEYQYRLAHEDDQMMTILKGTSVLEDQITILEPETPLVTIQDDPIVNQEVKAALNVAQILQRDNWPTLVWSLETQLLSSKVAYDVMIEDGIHTRWQLGHITYDGKTHLHMFKANHSYENIRKKIDAVKGKTVRVFLVPNILLAESTIGIDQIYGQILEFDEVSVIVK